MISVSGKNWEELRFNKRLVEKVKIDNDFSEILSKLIISREFSETEIFTIKNEFNPINMIAGKNINLKYLNIDLFNYLDLFFSLIKFSNPLPKD